MLDEVLLFIYGTAAAVILIAIVAYYYMPTLVSATQAQAEYAALRDAAPTLILAQDGKGVHICINSTAPQRVLIERSGIWIDAQKDCRINPSGNCVPGGQQSWPLCRWYLGTYRPGDSVAVVLKGNYATVVKNYTVAAVPVRR
jgi:type II secretory pathway pseudopilin PulG